MKRIRAIHPSAALFVGILIAFTLPFGYSAAGCGPTTAEYTGVDLLQADVGPGIAGDPEDEKYAHEIESQGRIWSWLLFVSALTGLGLAVLKHGKLWATLCAVTASLALALAIDLDFGDAYIGWVLAFFIPLGGLTLKILLLLGRLTRRVVRRFAPAVTTPDEPAVR